MRFSGSNLKGFFYGKVKVFFKKVLISRRKLIKVFLGFRKITGVTIIHHYNNIVILLGITGKLFKPHWKVLPHKLISSLFICMVINRFHIVIMEHSIRIVNRGPV